jgi:hypothetical protein
MEIKLWHFYHAYAQENQEDIWLPIVEEHVNILDSSGIASKLNKTYIGVVGVKSSADKISAIFKAKGIEHEICAVNDSGWEQVTLNKLYEFSLSNDGYVLYAHTKGAFYPTKVRDSHRRTMSEHLIGRWTENVDLLSKGFCATGLFFLKGSPEPKVKKPDGSVPKEIHPNIKRYRGFFAGNFWWCNLDFIKRMGYPSMENRIKAEGWMNNLYDSTDSFQYMVYDMLPNKLYEIFAPCLLLPYDERCLICPTLASEEV